MPITAADHTKVEGIKMSLLELFCEIDDFWQEFAPWWEREYSKVGKGFFGMSLIVSFD
jgi:hypothetical protein